MYDFNHKLLLWILCVKSHSHILVGHVTSTWWGGNKMGGVNFHHFYFIYMASMTKWHGCSIVMTMIKNWLQIIWYEHKQPYPHPPPTYVPTYLPTHPPTYPLSMHPPTYLPTTHLPPYLPSHPPNHPPIYLPTHLPTSSTYLPWVKAW
jgi:hypothetical protein